MKRRIFGVVLVVLMMVSLLPTTVFADGENTRRITIRYCIPRVFYFGDSWEEVTVLPTDTFVDGRDYRQDKGIDWKYLDSVGVPKTTFSSDDFVLQGPNGVAVPLGDYEVTGRNIYTYTTIAAGSYKLVSYPMFDGYEVDPNAVVIPSIGLRSFSEVNASNEDNYEIFIPIRKIGATGNFSLINRNIAWQSGDSSAASPSWGTNSEPTPPVTPNPPVAPSFIAKPTASTVLVNGKNIAFDAYNIEGNNYFKLRDLAYTLSGSEKQFEVGWDGANNAIALTSGQAYTAVGGEMAGKGSGDKTPTATTSKIYLDGTEVQLTAYNIEGNNYFKLRDIGIAFDFDVTWDGSRNTIVIDTSSSYTPD